MELESIRIAVAIIMIVFGTDQMIQPDKWINYIPDFVDRLLPFTTITKMQLHASGNIALGILLIITNSETILVLTIIWWLTIIPFAMLDDWRVGY